MKRILFVNDTVNNVGGAESYMYSLKELLEHNGFLIKVVGGDGGLGLVDSFFSRWYSTYYYNLVTQSVNEFKPDLVHVHGIARVVSPSVMAASAKFGVPIIQTVHDYHYVCPKMWMIDDQERIIQSHDSFVECLLHHLPKKNIVYSLFKHLKVIFHRYFIKRYITHFICPSKNLGEWYGNIYGVNKVTHIPHFVDVDLFSYSPIHNYNNLLFIGRLSKEKGVDSLIRAFRLVVDKNKLATLTVVGDGIERAALESLSDKLDLTKKIQFVGKVPYHKLPDYYKECTCVVIPSLCLETGPLTVIESAASGRPIAGSNAGGIKEWLESHRIGVLFERGNIKDMADKIQLLLTNQELCNELNRNQLLLRDILGKDIYFEKVQSLYNKYL